MDLSRPIFVAALLVAGLLMSAPGVAEVVEATIPGEDCAEPCPGDSSDRNCSPSCDQCTCCLRAMSALLMLPREPGTPRAVEILEPTAPAWCPLALAKGVFHPPRI